MDIPEDGDNSRAKIHIGGNVGGNVIDGDVAGGDIYKNISNSTIKSKVEGDPQISEALKRLTEIVANSDDPAAKSTYDEFKKELQQPQPNKSRLEKFWSALQKILPAVSQIANNIAPIIAAV
jgi:hypothetical protein